ncbi:unnamed protein product [Phytophthora fragariaefolia]|uniref:Unnamed protein product n=1 Tax=Phytophthora fragariaefolia TaxID=1490495 RepID=A0A9W6TRS8_9STRA|nr:unnamed protein product [Phytophthora fragariaefolia]
MLDKGKPSRRASQPDVMAPRMSNQSLPRSSSSLLAGLKAFRGSLTNKTSTEIASLHKERHDRNSFSTRRISAGAGSSEDEEDVDQVLDIPRPDRDQQSLDAIEGGNINSNSGDDTDDTEMASRGKHSQRLWQLLAPKSKDDSNQATVMYSISFYPWKMEPRGYYSHPEAAVNWVPDTASPRCQICLTAFTLTRRRHHCRLCGHLVCANCSHDRTYLPFTGSAPSQHRLIKDGAPQRTCSCCASTLRNMAGQDDPRVKRFTVAVSSVKQCRTTTPTTSSVITASRPVVEVEVERPSPWLRRTGMALTNSDIEDKVFFIESTKALQLDQCSRGTTHHFPLRLSVTRAEELDEVLSARACSRAQSEVNYGENPDSRQFVMCSAWLGQWLQYVRVDSASAEAAMWDAFSNQPSEKTNPDKTRRSKPSETRSHMKRPPRPGPVTNYLLLDFVNGELVPKPNLQRSIGSHGGGDYRVVSQEVWVTFLELYGGGPSIQVPLRHDGGNISTKEIAPGKQSRSPARSAKQSQWIISELDDSIPTLAVSPPVGKYSSATRKGAARGQATSKTTQHRKSPGAILRSTARKRLVSASSMPSLIKKTTGHYSLRCESSSNLNSTSRWKLCDEGGSRARAETMAYERTADIGSTNTVAVENSVIASRNTTGDASSTLAAVSAFASAATLARERSVISLTRHSAAISSRSNGSILENGETCQ